MSEWQPIETAPKDGTSVLVFPAIWNGKTTSIAKWNTDRCVKKPSPYWDRDDAFTVRESRENPPTHWMPLPPAPSKDM